jgi:hypothetical protein
MLSVKFHLKYITLIYFKRGEKKTIYKLLDSNRWKYLNKINDGKEWWCDMLEKLENLLFFYILRIVKIMVLFRLVPPVVDLHYSRAWILVFFISLIVFADCAWLWTQIRYDTRPRINFGWTNSAQNLNRVADLSARVNVSVSLLMGAPN